MNSFTTLPPVEPLLVFRDGNDDLYKTIMLIGVNRSGTSATAALLDAMGIAMDGSHDGHFERSIFKNNIEDDTAISEEISVLNLAYDNWGLQCQHVSFSVAFCLSRKVRNPHLIVVFRDPVAIATRWLSISEKGYKDPMTTIQRVWVEMSCMFDILNMTIPSAAISFERLKQDPSAAVKSLSKWLRITPKEFSVNDVIGGHSGYLIQ